jgi:hypothetical protein
MPSHMWRFEKVDIGASFRGLRRPIRFYPRAGEVASEYRP